jgi:predicted dehydrogenase
MEKLKVGIAGFGIVGKRRKECIDRHPNLYLVAVCDKTFKEEGLLANGIRYYQAYPRLLEEDLDVLIVCMTNDISAEVTIAGLKAGLHVFCEKPPGRSVEDILTVKSHEKRCPKLKLMYGFNHRYHQSVQEALRILHSGELGGIINMRAVYGKAKLITFDQSDWRTKREIAGGGILLDQGIHMVDLMRLFAGDFLEFQSIISNGHWGYDVEDNVYALMRTEAGVVGMLHSSATQWRHRFHLDINLERGGLILGGISSGTKSYGAETLTIVRADPDNDMGDPTEHVNHFDHNLSWDEEINTFADYILNGKKVQNGNSQDALSTMQHVFKIYFADPTWRETYGILNPDL